MNNIEIIKIPKISDPRGNLAIVEGSTIPFDIKRVYYLYDVPSESYRGGHAHKELYQVLIAVSGSFDVMIHNGIEKQKVTLNKPIKGMLIKPGTWREIDNFSSGSVCLVLASEVYKEEDYIYHFDEFERYIKTISK